MIDALLWRSAQLVTALLVAAAFASVVHAQEWQPWTPQTGFSTTPQGGLSTWSGGSGFAVTPDGGLSTWNSYGGFYTSPNGGLSVWQGPPPPVFLPLGGPVGGYGQ